ncbi:MAG TPA: transglycosylase SLT domain-containing protein [Bryobacteraceae bacterium]|nr:transglycosylase SLT domain-containing protein [Bryobacteraceae bacterium]
MKNTSGIAGAKRASAAQNMSLPAQETSPPEADDESLPPALRAPWKGDLDGMAPRRIVRVLVPFRRPEFFYMDGRPVGIYPEAFQQLERALNKKYKTTASNRITVALLPTPLDELRDRMVGGYGDIAAYGISISEVHEQAVDFSAPTITGLKMIVVTGPGAPKLDTIDDLSGKEIWISPMTRMKADLESLNARFHAQGKPPVVMRETDALLDPGDVMEMVNAGAYPVALMQSQMAEFWGKVFDDAKPRMDLAVANDVSLGWAIRKGTPQLKAFLDDFIRSHGARTSFGNTLLRRYLKDGKYIKNAREDFEVKRLAATEPWFRKYGEEYQFDYLLLAAQGFQESGLDQQMKSKVGAVGIMQVMPSTAAAPPVNIPNIDSEENNIHAGVLLLHFLVNDYFNEPSLDQFNRTLFAIAAYNAGPARINKCRQLAKEMGYDPNKWFGDVEVAAAKVMGRETTQYVSNIYKYYLAYRMAAQLKTEARRARR